MVIDSPVREFNPKRDITVFYVRVGKDDEPALWIQRNAWGKSYAYVLPLDQAYLLDDDRTLMEKGFIACRELGLQDYKTDVYFLMDLLVKHIDGLVQNIPPKKLETREQMIGQMERAGVIDMKVNGESIL